MSIIAYQCAVGVANAQTLTVSSSTPIYSIAPSNDSVDTNDIIIIGTGSIYSFGVGAAGIPVNKTVWFNPSGPITLKQDTITNTLSLLGSIDRTFSHPSFGIYHWDGISKWTERSFIDTTVAPGGGGGGTWVDAPSDGTTYGRMNAAWNQALAHNNDTLDGGNF